MTTGEPQQRALLLQEERVWGGGKYHCLESLMKVGGQVNRCRSSKVGLCNGPQRWWIQKNATPKYDWRRQDHDTLEQIAWDI